MKHDPANKYRAIASILLIVLVLTIAFLVVCKPHWTWMKGL